MKASDDKVLHELTFTCCRPLNHLGPHISWPDKNFSFPSVVWAEKEALNEA